MKAGIAGYGKMGRGIFNLFCESPMALTVFEVDAERVADGARRFEKRMQRAVRSGMLSETAFAERMAAVKFSSSLDDLCGCDLVIEAVPENFEAKVDLLCRVEKLVSPQAIMASNTSSLSVTDMASRLEHPARFCGYHFFHPVQLTTVVEIIRWDGVARQTLDALCDVSRCINRVPLIVKDLPGSCLNVSLSIQTCEALYLLEQGFATPSTIDRIAAGMGRIGPCEAMDVVGIPFLTESVGRMLQYIPIGYAVPELCQKLIQDGRHGKYAGKGLYLYREDVPYDDAPEYYINPKQTHSMPTAPSDDEALYERLLYPIFLSILHLANMGLGEVKDLCLGIQDILGMKIDLYEKIRSLGGAGLREAFGRLSRQVGPRFDSRPLDSLLRDLDKRA